MTVLDSSAILSWLQDEPGADVVERAMDADCRCSSAIWSEVAQKVLAAGRDWPAVKALLLGCGVSVEPVTAADAEAAASLWLERPQLSPADRLCLVLGERLADVVLTADRAWGETEKIVQVRH